MIERSLLDTIASAVNSTAWQDSEGIVGDSSLVQGLLTAYNRNPTNYQLRSYLMDYIGVQVSHFLSQNRALIRYSTMHFLISPQIWVPTYTDRHG